jgi:hypothetical protein
VSKNVGVKLHNDAVRQFASDNYAGTHPEVLAALADANGGHQVAYGEDVYTARLAEVMRGIFGEQTEVRAGVPLLPRVTPTSTPTRVGHRNASADSNCSPSTPPTASSRPTSSTARPGATETSTARNRSL